MNTSANTQPQPQEQNLASIVLDAVFSTSDAIWDYAKQTADLAEAREALRYIKGTKYAMLASAQAMIAEAGNNPAKFVVDLLATTAAGVLGGFAAGFAGPVGTVTGGVGASILAQEGMDNLYETNATYRTGLERINQTIYKAGDVAQTLADVPQQVVEFFGELGDSVTSAMSSAIDTISQRADATADYMVDTIRSAIATVVESAMQGLINSWDWMANTDWSGIINDITTAFTDITDSMTNLFNRIFGTSGVKPDSDISEAIDSFPRTTPIALDINKSGAIETISLANSKTYFDIDNDNFTEKLQWISPTDGWLAVSNINYS